MSEIKIDRSFVSDMTSNARDAAIVRWIIDLGHDLEREVVAEGIENQATLKALTDLGCDLGQGHWISRPLASTGLRQWMLDPARTPQ